MTSPNKRCWTLGLNTFLGPFGPSVSPVLFHIALPLPPPAGVPPALCPETQWCFRKRTHFHMSWLPGSQVNQTLKTRNRLGTSGPPILTASSQEDFCSSSCNISVSFNIFELFPGRRFQPWEDISRVSLHVNWVTPEREFLLLHVELRMNHRKKKKKNTTCLIPCLLLTFMSQWERVRLWAEKPHMRSGSLIISSHSTWQIFVAASAQRRARDQQDPPWSWTSRLHLTLFNLHYLHKGSVSKYHHTEVRASICEFQEDKMQSITVILSFVSFFLCGVGWNIYMYTCINVSV